MTPIEALLEFDLKPNTTHRRRNVEAAIKAKMMHAQRAYQAAFTDAAQETALRKLQRLQEAARVVRAEVKGDVLRIQGQAKTVPRPTPPSPSPMPASVPRHSPSAIPPNVPAAWMQKMASLLKPAVPLQALWRFGQGIFSILYAVWILLTWPLRLLLQKRVLTACCVTLLAACALWLAWAFCTTGVHGLSMKVKHGSEWINRITVMATDLRDGHAVSWKRPGTSLTIRNSSSAVILVDNKTYESGAVCSQSVDSGFHEVEIRANRTRSWSDVNFPAGGSVEIESHRTNSSTILAITVEMPDAPPRVSQDSGFSTRPIAFETASKLQKVRTEEP
jgi:hypothetical protein